jgi:hypothetical protein
LRLIQPNQRFPQFKAYDPLLGNRFGVTIRQIEMKPLLSRSSTSRPSRASSD